MGDQSKKSVWGPALWLYLHTAADFCDNPEAFSGFILSLVGTLPCQECRKHLMEYTSRLPPAATIRDATSAAEYVRKLHDHVDMITGKKKPQQAPAPQPAPPVSAVRRGLGLSSGSPSGIRAALGGVPPPAHARPQPQRTGPRPLLRPSTAAPRLRRR